jgi:exonuclease III
LNVKGIRNETGEIIKGLEELKQDITILTETKKKGNGVEILGPYLHFYSGVPKKKRAKRGVSILVKRDIRDILQTGRQLTKT